MSKFLKEFIPQGLVASGGAFGTILTLVDKGVTSPYPYGAVMVIVLAFIISRGMSTRASLRSGQAK
jgi:hypothetical protein